MKKVRNKMKIQFETAGQFQKIIEAVSKLLDVAFFTVRKNGISLKGIDPTHVAMVDLFIPQEMASDYDLKQDHRLHINLFDLNKFMKRGTATELLELFLDQPRNKLKVKFKKHKSTRTFSLSLVAEGEDEDAPTPSLDFNAKAKMSSSDLQRAIKDAQIVGDYLSFIIEEDCLTLEASGDTGDVSIEIREFVEAPDLKGKQSAIYSLEFLGDILGTIVSEEVSLEFSTEMPIYMKFDLEHDGFLSFFLAPRVEEEEEEVDEDGVVYDEDEEGDSYEEEEDLEEEEPEEENPKKTKKKTAKKSTKKKSTKEKSEE